MKYILLQHVILYSLFSINPPHLFSYIITGLHDSNNVTDTYELIYNPPRPGKFTGKIKFSNTKTGQFWYNLNMVAKAAASSTVLQHLECMLGTDTKILIPVENNSGNLFIIF